MTAESQALLDRLQQLPQDERMAIAQQLWDQAERDLVDRIDAEVRSGQMPTFTRAEADARWQRRLAELNAARS